MSARGEAANRILAERFRERISHFVVKRAETLEPEAAAALLKQFTPDELELEEIEGFEDDPLHEEDADIHPFADVVHKYPNKLLYLTTDECPVYCRYCTRKRKTLLSSGHANTDLNKITAYLEQHPLINEIIFSGGDPLMLSARAFSERARVFLSQPTIRFLRLHTRALTTAPGLMSNRLFTALGELREEYFAKQITFVLHINTAAEISPETRTLVERLRILGIPCFAQTVLLHGINDSARSLSRLCETLIANNIQPYYLHQLDRVTGSAHFEVSDEAALEIYDALKASVPRYMMPQLVRDSKRGKRPL
jgi:L-lysine 2,3-aminomutase